jgi:predicted nucleic acid-binding Zn finger protein
MFELETLLALRHVAKRNLRSKKIKDTNIVFKEEAKTFYLVFKLEDSEGNDRLYKNNITELVKNHGSLRNLFLALVASEMLLAGYNIIPIENGWLCIGGEEIYSMKDNECSCMAYIHNPSKPCKHLLYKEALQLQRSRIAKWKANNL